MKKRMVALQVDMDLFERIAREAQDEGRSISGQIRYIVKMYLERIKK